MITYEELLARLRACADEKYVAFHGRLLKNENVRLLGVRVPILKRLAKEMKGEFANILAFPDEYYEVTFLKCQIAGLLPYAEYVSAAKILVERLDNWGTCDCFKAPCVTKYREEFLPIIREWLKDGREFVVRYALVMLLSYYVTAEYLEIIFEAVCSVSAEKYYVMMASAWLVAEVLARHFNEGVAFLQKNLLPVSVHNKAILKARESFRLSADEKELLKNLKR